MADIPKGIHYKITHPAHKLWMIALVAAAGSALCIGTLAFFDGVAKGDYLLVAPFGATMVLVFGLPQSPLAHPKNVVFGHLTTAITGIIFANLLPVTFWSLGLAVGVGIFLMIMLNVTHPPAGGNPLLIMLGAHTSILFAFYPIFAGSCIIVLIALLYHALVSRLEYAWVNKPKEGKDV
ncbi:HPP family protein [Photobacterium kishitanii]|uniref:HPP family protein n=1 Tax=Photobacterium kishitanii TaxID=318456 RepID=A0A2T3QV61_9GAMM|nr:HPP family protein [Photobacterium kishitanii]KJG09933.1 HPP family protein [Photobacterium kishitanii]KJG58533.1 HPP family protein [Photobacterium kishitanii]KJG61820.1 HPP family protein [Photobacterium kishitanii]KJG66428.1 HPP family protein [Photobacterium kishitanii]KJG70083.1 HPP family protein [Photobacterium kishitanii]